MTNKVLLVLIALGLGYLVFDFYRPSAPEPPTHPAPPPVPFLPPPVPEPTSPPSPAPEVRLAPEGVLFVVTRFSEPHEDGVRGFSPGTEVRLLRQEAGYCVVTDGQVEARRPKSWFTRDMDLAEELRVRKNLTDRQIAERQARERAVHEAAVRAQEKQRESALAAVEAGRRPASEPVGPEISAARDRRPLRLGAWNLEHFGSRNDPPRTEGDVQAIADFIGRLGVQVLAVSEVSGERPLQDLAKRLGPDWKCVLGTSGRLGQEGQVAPGILWDDSRVEMVGAGELSELATRLPSGLVFHREPVVAAFRDRSGGADFRVIALHLKAGRTPEDFERREAEARALRVYLENIVADDGEDRDIIIMGDFNHCYTSGEAEIFTEGGFARFLRGRGRSVIHFDRQIDHAVPLGTFAEVDGASFTVHNQDGMRDPQKWRTVYSDHFPVTVDLESAPDDDPAAKLGALGKRLH